MRSSRLNAWYAADFLNPLLKAQKMNSCQMLALKSLSRLQNLAGF
jgi:hypothetical protein